ncbi:hypothetical protein RHOFW510R12_02270 [Rhodanobacter sp. FW510-R12]
MFEGVEPGGEMAASLAQAGGIVEVAQLGFNGVKLDDAVDRLPGQRAATGLVRIDEVRRACTQQASSVTPAANSAL